MNTGHQKDKREKQDAEPGVQSRQVQRSCARSLYVIFGLFGIPLRLPPPSSRGIGGSLLISLWMPPPSEATHSQQGVAESQ